MSEESRKEKLGVFTVVDMEQGKAPERVPGLSYQPSLMWAEGREKSGT
jgi:hypothetical protein